MVLYPNNRRMLLWAMATALPMVMDAAASAASSTAQSSDTSKNPVNSTRNRTANPAALLATDRNATTGVGAPSYTSGTHIWNGAADILNPKPATNRTMPTSSA